MVQTKKTMRIAYNGGTDDQGKTIVLHQTFSGLITSATNDKFKAAANAIASLANVTKMYVEVITTERLN